MRKLIVLLALASFMGSVPAAFAVDLNWNGLRQNWQAQVNAEKQQAGIWGSVLEAGKVAVPGTTRPVASGRVQVGGCP